MLVKKIGRGGGGNPLTKIRIHVSNTYFGFTVWKSIPVAVQFTLFSPLYSVVVPLEIFEQIGIVCDNCFVWTISGDETVVVDCDSLILIGKVYLLLFQNGLEFTEYS